MRVGVILAARAPVPWLDAALESVLSQEPAVDELVVVDHASEPPLRVVRDGVRVVRLEEGAAGGGPAAARQAGLEALDSDWVGLVDADDVWCPGKLAAQLAALKEHPGAAVCFGRAVVVDADGRATGETLGDLAAGLYKAESMRPMLFGANPIPAASALVRRADLESVGGFTGGGAAPLPAGSDWDLWLRLAAAGARFLSVPEAAIEYRRHEEGLTSSVRRLAEAALEIHERHVGLVDEQTARKARAADLVALAQGLVRERRYDEAAAALREAEELGPLTPHVRNLKRLIAIPGIRGLLGRRNPYR